MPRDGGIGSQCPGTEALGPNAPGRRHWVPMPGTEALGPNAPGRRHWVPMPGTEALGPNAPGRRHWVPMPWDGDGDSVLSRAPSFG